MKKISACTSALFFTGVLSVGLLLGGCQKKQEEPKPAATPATAQTAPAVDSTAIKAQAAKATEKAAKEIKMTGTWEGEMSGKTAILKITEQKGNEFSGTVVLMFKEKINQKVKGTLNPETKEVKVSDQLHSVDAGDYVGKLNDELNKYSGTFTVRSNGQKLKFNLKLK